MAWLVGIDEAGYGPNLGPFVMTAVVVRVADADAGGCLWQRLASHVRRGAGKRDGRLVIDDSKVVYGAGRGLAGLERGVQAALAETPPHLAALAAGLCPDDAAELADEAWYVGDTVLPAAAAADEVPALREGFRAACAGCDVGPWQLRSVVVCPRQFNALTAAAGSKAAVVGQGFVRLLRWAAEQTGGEEPLFVTSDKQGGRNAYAGLIEQAFQTDFVWTMEENARRSHYRVRAAGRPVELTFQPRADGEQLCVALASMVSKYLRELFMAEFNRFWQGHVPGLAATAGYPVDAARFLAAIRPAVDALQLPLEAIWRQR